VEDLNEWSEDTETETIEGAESSEEEGGMNEAEGEDSETLENWEPEPQISMDILLQPDDYQPPSLDRVPHFTRLIHQSPPHQAQARIPVGTDTTSPLAYFKLFVSDNTICELVKNTNLYAEKKNAGIGTSRTWHATHERELKVWFAIIIYMGLHRNSAKTPRPNLYWNPESDCMASPMRFMSLTRFEQIKRFFHISKVEDLGEPASHTSSTSSSKSPNPPRLAKRPAPAWYEKVEPMAVPLQLASQKYLLPATEIAVDEMMVKFMGKSSHTIKIKNKPIKQGYKIFALCWRGYTINFTYSSRVKGIAGVPKIVPKPNKPKPLAPTYRVVDYLVSCLPYQQFRFNIYLDNLFTNVLLFRLLRQKGIGACGTTRKNSEGYPKTFKNKKEKGKSTYPEWNTLEGELVGSGDVLALLWMDQNLVMMLTTIHEVDNIGCYITRNRRR